MHMAQPHKIPVKMGIFFSNPIVTNVAIPKEITTILGIDRISSQIMQVLANLHG